ncbi:(4Fe-4S)-binding protein [Kitasatospora sp. NPDC056181]|uniref:(4Fe-4S)-binding protein n=1 Tax=Kitasatospora sp. NPDC056181 TaxID=3345737 RepID=UPI0035D8AA49
MGGEEAGGETDRGTGGTTGQETDRAAGQETGGRRRPGARTYEAAGIAVSFDPQVCRHAAECVRGLASVFDTARRPWITPDAAEPGVVAEVVRRCPTGALRYRLADGGTEVPERPTSVRRTPDGRLLLRGELRVTDSGGAVRETPRAMLCGCGRSAGQPYCDRSGACGGGQDGVARDGRPSAAAADR